MRTHFRLLHFLIAAVFLLVCFNAPAISQEKDRAISETVLGDDVGVELGKWRTKVQDVFDARSRTLVACQYSVFDPAPSRDLDFLWIPDDLTSDRSGPVSGRGRLVWRVKAMPAYDASAIYSTYVGEVRRGRPEGLGHYVNRDGLAYDGEWRNGRFEGKGVLQLPNGEEYHGKFFRGRAVGFGRYIDMTGEVFEGTFVDGLRQGEGKTTLPGGAIYQSRWSKGTEVQGSVRMRVAQLGTQPPGLASANDIRLGVTVRRKPTKQGIEPGEILGYAAKVSGDKLLVQPDDPQLVSVWKEKGVIQVQINALKPSEAGGYRQSLFGFDKNTIYPPQFSFDFQNKSAARIEITGFYLDVKKSESDNQPALDIDRGSERETCGHEYNSGRGRYSNGNFAPYFEMRNYGWGAVEQGTLRFGLRPSNDKTNPTNFEFTKEIGRLEKRTKVDIADTIANAGGKLDLLRHYGKNGFQCKVTDDKSDNPAQCLDQLRTTGAFGSLSKIISLDGIDIVVGLRGKLEYKYKNSKGEIVSDASPIRVDLSIGGLTQQPECGEGGPPEPIRLHPVALKLDQENYEIQLPLLTKSIDPGSSRQFTLAVNAPQASRHDFQVVAKLSNGQEIRSRSIDLLYFAPNWYPSPNY
jgi:hypothetical protein